MNNLHEIDFYLWTLEQTKLLETKEFEKVDWENLIDEIRDMGDNRYAKISSWTIRIIQHKLKINYVGTADCLKHWNKEINNFRVDIESYITTTIKIKLESELDKLYKRACRLFRDDYEDIELPEKCPYTLDEVLGDE